MGCDWSRTGRNRLPFQCVRHWLDCCTGSGSPAIPARQRRFEDGSIWLRLPSVGCQPWPGSATVRATLQTMRDRLRASAFADSPAQSVISVPRAGSGAHGLPPVIVLLERFRFRVLVMRHTCHRSAAPPPIFQRVPPPPIPAGSVRWWPRSDQRPGERGIPVEEGRWRIVRTRRLWEPVTHC